MPEIQECKIKEVNSVRIIDYQLKTSIFNIVCNTKFAERDIEDKIRYVIEKYNESLFLGEQDH